jgi:hypothetical protein
MKKSQEPRWYYARVDFGPGIQPWLTAIEATSPEEARSALARGFAADGVTATIGEVGLVADLPPPVELDTDADVRR